MSVVLVQLYVLRRDFAVKAVLGERTESESLLVAPKTNGLDWAEEMEDSPGWQVLVLGSHDSALALGGCDGCVRTGRSIGIPTNERLRRDTTARLAESYY